MRLVRIFMVLMFLIIAGHAQKMAGDPTLVYIGTYTGEQSKGIYLFRLQPEGDEVFQNVTLVPLGLVAEMPNPSFIELDRKRRLLFAVSEVDQGWISAFSIDPAGKLTLVNQRSSRGTQPCQLALDKDGRNVLVANCGSGSVAVLGVAVREGRHGASHDDLSDGYERISRFHLSQLAYLAGKLDAMPEGEGTVLDNSCIMWLSNMWAGWKHDNMKVPVVLAGGLGGALETGRSLDYLYAGDDNRKLCSLYLSIMDRMGVKLDHFGDADTRLAGL